MPPPLNRAGNSSARGKAQLLLPVSLCVRGISQRSICACWAGPWLNRAQHCPSVPPGAVDSSHQTVPHITCLPEPTSPRPPSYKPKKRWGPGWGCHFSPPRAPSARCNSTPLLIRKTFQAITQKTSFSSHLPCFVRVCVFSGQLKGKKTWRACVPGL